LRVTLEVSVTGLFCTPGFGEAVSVVTVPVAKTACETRFDVETLKAAVAVKLAVRL